MARVWEVEYGRFGNSVVTDRLSVLAANLKTAFDSAYKLRRNEIEETPEDWEIIQIKLVGETENWVNFPPLISEEEYKKQRKSNGKKIKRK